MITILPNIKIHYKFILKEILQNHVILRNLFFDDFIKLKIIICYSTFVIFRLLNQLKMIFQIGWAALAAIFTFSIAMVVWGRNGDGSIDI